MEEENDSINEQQIAFTDGLVIDREDDKDYWLIEVYMTKDYLELFQTFKDDDELLVKVKISKESNDPAYFITRIIKITPIMDNFTLLLSGSLVKTETKDVTTTLSEYIAAGYNQETILKKLKKSF